MLLTASFKGLASAAEEALPALAAKPAEKHNCDRRVGRPRKTQRGVHYCKLHQYLCEAAMGEQTTGCDVLRATCTTVAQLCAAYGKAERICYLVARFI